MQDGSGSTRERLVSAAHQIVLVDGYGAASVAAVAEAAGTGASTLYRHFPSKAELFVEVFRTVCRRELEAATAAAEALADPADRVLAVIETFCTRALTAPRLAWALLAEPVDPLVEQERLIFRHQYRDVIARLIDAGIVQGQLPPQDPSLTAAALVGGIAEALIGPTAPNGDAEGPRRPTDTVVVAHLLAFTRRALGVG